MRRSLFGRESALTCRLRRVRAGHVGPLRAPVCCYWFGRATDVLVLRGGDESNGAYKSSLSAHASPNACVFFQKQNFLRDQSGMKKQLSTLQQLLQVMDPELYRHFEKTEGLNLFFCFRLVPFLLCGAMPLGLF